MNHIGVLEAFREVMKVSGETFSARVTLFVGGIIVFGDMIHPDAYYKALATLLKLPVGGDPKTAPSAKTISEWIEKGVELAKEPGQERKYLDEIYLKNVKIWCPPNPPKLCTNPMMVLKIESIDGFMYGDPVLS